MYLCYVVPTIISITISLFQVEVVTGEENETELYGHRAKLFRFMSGEWKERGIGVVKVLEHKDTGKLRYTFLKSNLGLYNMGSQTL